MRQSNRTRRKISSGGFFKRIALDILLFFSIIALLLFIIWTNFNLDENNITKYFEWMNSFRIKKSSILLTTQTSIKKNLDFKDADTAIVTSLNLLNLTSNMTYMKDALIVPVALLEARKILDKHPFRRLSVSRSIGTISMVDAMVYLHNQIECKNKPIFISMAQVSTDLYWQLIENFIYTMVKFNVSDCSVMICVTDRKCMDMCRKSGFPCYYFGYDIHNPGKPLPSALEQIAQLKLLHLPQALSKGVGNN